VVALAAIVGDPACNLNEIDTLNTNYESTKILVEISKYYHVEHIIFASSCSVYGANSNMELNEGSFSIQYPFMPKPELCQRGLF